MREYYADGKIKAEGKFEDGLRQGIFTTYDEQGVKAAEDEYKNNMLRYHREFNPDGKIVSEKIVYNPSQ